MLFMIGIMVIIVNWCLKLLVGWIAYSICMWMQWPEWAVITIVAVAAVSTTFKMEYTRS